MNGKVRAEIDGNFIYVYLNGNKSEEFTRRSAMSGLYVSNRNAWRFKATKESFVRRLIKECFDPSIVDLDFNVTPLAPVTPITSEVKVESNSELKVSIDKIISVLPILKSSLETKISYVNDALGTTQGKVSNVEFEVSKVSEAYAKLDEIIGEHNALIDTLKSDLNDLYEEVKSNKPIIVTLKSDNIEVTKDIGIQHYKFIELLELVQALNPEDCNIWISGPAGSGKTTGARKLAEVLNRPFYFNGAIDTEYKLSGFIDANGRIISTAFRQAWEEGGVYLFDECDGSMPGALLAFNAALANGHANFPDKVVLRHTNTVVLAAANTWGFGGDANYVGRAKLDAAFLDRFVTISWDYDENLERRIAGNDVWVDVVINTRKLCFEKGAQFVISPRASIKGAQLLNKGIDKKKVVSAVFSRYMSHTSWEGVGVYVKSFLDSTNINIKVDPNNEWGTTTTYRYLHGYEDKISAIKTVRELTGLGLRDAKDLVESLSSFNTPIKLKIDPDVDNLLVILSEARRNGTDIRATREL